MSGNSVFLRFDKKIGAVDVLDQYTTNKERVLVTVTADGKYLITEPMLSQKAEDLFVAIRQRIRIHDDTISHDTMISELKEKIQKESASINALDLYLKEKDSIEYYFERDLHGYGILDPLINDPNIEDILGVRWDVPLAVKHRKFGVFQNMETNVKFTSESMMAELINKISNRYGQRPTEISPASSFADINNVRFTVTGNNVVTPQGPTLSIRIPSNTPITIYNLLKQKILTPLAAAYLWMVIDLKGFGLVIGSPSAGKTTMINAMFTMANPNWHFFTIEDVLELRLNHRFVSQHQITANSTLQKQNVETTHDVFEMLKLAMRFKPEFVIVGEVLGDEARGLFQVAQSGSGCVSSFHASSPIDALAKLQSDEFGVTREQTRAVTYVLHMSQVYSGSFSKRAVLSITEPVVKDKETFKKEMNVVFQYDKKKGTLVPVSDGTNCRDDIDILVKKSRKLDDAKIVLGIDDIREDFEKRIAILQKIQDGSVQDISSEINSYYQSL